MPRRSLLPFDPAADLLASVRRVLLAGEPGVAAITPSGQPSWSTPAVTACPTGHYLFPAGWRVYLDRDLPSAKAPMCILSVPEEGKMKSPVLGGQWAILVKILFLVKKDYSLTTLDTVLQRAQLILTETLTLDADSSIQQPQARLSTSTLLVFGSQKWDNFDETATGELQEAEDLIDRVLAFTVTCALTAAS